MRAFAVVCAGGAGLGLGGRPLPAPPRPRGAGPAPPPPAPPPPAPAGAAPSHLGGRHGDVVTGPGMPFDRAMAEARAAWADPLAHPLLTTLAPAAAAGGR